MSHITTSEFYDWADVRQDGRAVNHEGKSAAAYRRIEELITWQGLAPGALVSEKQLMEMTELGRTPVREAIQKLSRERMVTVYPSRGILVPGMSVEDQLKRLELRRPLDALAVSLACRRATEAQRAAMTELVDRLGTETFTLRGYARTIRDTHQLITDSAQNEYLADAIAPLQGLSRRFWIGNVDDEEQQINTGNCFHRAMLAAILDRDEATAQQHSRELNDYLTDFALAALGDAARDRIQR